MKLRHFTIIITLKQIEIIFLKMSKSTNDSGSNIIVSSESNIMKNKVLKIVLQLDPKKKQF